MEISKEIIELAEEIKKHRISTKLTEELKIKNKTIENHSKKLEENIKILKSKTIKQNLLLEQIKNLEEENKNLEEEESRSKKEYTFIVTTPNEASNAIHNEISKELSEAKHEVLICSPWITYIVEELSNLKSKNVNLKIITRFTKEDTDKGITDLNKLSKLKDNFGAEIRYNNDLHAKMVIVDNSVAIISSANLTKRGLLFVNYEAGICLRNKDKVNKIFQFFNDIWKESKPLTEQIIKNVSSNKK